MNQYQDSVKEKIRIMKGLLFNIGCGVELTNKIPSGVDFMDHAYFANPFLYSVIFELSIKSMWEISYKKVFDKKKYGHRIVEVYPDLKKDFCDFISNQYHLEINRFREIINNHQNNYEKGESPTTDFLSIEECLAENNNLIVNGKYEFQLGDKINVVSGTIPNQASDNFHVLNPHLPREAISKIECVYNHINNRTNN